VVVKRELMKTMILKRYLQTYIYMVMNLTCSNLRREENQQLEA
jgi:hypothetical protein